MADYVAERTRLAGMPYARLDPRGGRRRIREAILVYVDSLLAHGDSVPMKRKSYQGTVTISLADVPRSAMFPIHAVAISANAIKAGLSKTVSADRISGRWVDPRQCRACSCSVFPISSNHQM